MSPTRPRVEGDREEQVLDAAFELLLEVGYDRFTLDAAARRARASKATLYRRWESKQRLVLDALVRAKQAPPVDPPDTGSLRDDLLAAFCGPRGMAGHATGILGAVVTAVATDEEFARLFREEFIAPKVALSLRMFERAQERGEIPPGLDLELIGPALPGIVMHRAFLLGLPPDNDTVERIVDHIILPAVGYDASGTSPRNEES